MSELSKKLGLDQIPLDELVKRAHNEISALCHQKQWRMTIPVQPDDSDIVLSEALQAQEKEIERLRAANEALTAELAQFESIQAVDHSDMAAMKARAERAEADEERLKFHLHGIFWEASNAIGDTAKSRVAVGVIATTCRNLIVDEKQEPAQP